MKKMMLKMQYKIMLFFLMIINVSYATFTFHTKPTIIEIGKDLTVICTFKNLNINTFLNSQTKWFLNNNNVFTNEIPNISLFSRIKINHLKFISYKSDKKLQLFLKIKKINEEDILLHFSCSVGIYRIYFYLNKNNNTLINMPLKNIHSSKYDDDMKSISLNFKKIYPIPKCYLTLKNNIRNFIKENIKKIGRYEYAIKLYLNFDMYNSCEKNITITCDLIDKKFNIDIEKIKICKFNFILILIFGILLIIIIILLIIIIILCKKKLKRTFRKKRIKLEEESFFNENFS